MNFNAAADVKIAPDNVIDGTGASLADIGQTLPLTLLVAPVCVRFAESDSTAITLEQSPGLCRLNVLRILRRSPRRP